MNQQHYTLNKAIIKTISYFDIFNIPLRFNKIKLFLYNYKLDSDKQLQDALELLIKKNYLDKFDEYYFLTGRERIVKLRYIRKRFCILRWKRAQKAAKALQLIPFIRLVGVTNSLSIDNSNANSDIDFFIITRKNRLWLTRALTVILLDILRLNKSKYRISNRICLGFFIDTSKMNLSIFNINNYDLYHTYWLVHTNPIYDVNTYVKFINQNKWLNQKLPNFQTKFARIILRDHQIKKNRFLIKISKIFEYALKGKIGNFLECLFAKIQIRRIKKLEKDKLPIIKLNKSIMKLGAYNKNKKFNDLLRKNFSRFYNE